MGEPGAVLMVAGLAAGYDGRAVVSDIDLVLRSGEILGLLGANGAGKSTLLKALTGQIGVLRGSIRIDGVDLAAAPVAAKARFGIAVDGPDLPSGLTGWQYLELVASIRGCGPAEFADGDVAARLALGGWIDKGIATYSVGTKAKISIAAALLGQPLLVIFDESLNGLDPVVAFEVKAIIREVAAGGGAVIVSTHVVESMPGLCSRAMFLADGMVAREWDRAELLEAQRHPGAFEAAVMQALRDLKQLEA
jgi:ABC-2 type transport system ATP-binding protein